MDKVRHGSMAPLARSPGLRSCASSTGSIRVTGNSHEGIFWSRTGYDFFQSSFVKNDFLFQTSDKSSRENYVPPIGR
jgi:hypothetical protein